jgi:hypothetical protein
MTQASLPPWRSYTGRASWTRGKTAAPLRCWAVTVTLRQVHDGIARAAGPKIKTPLLPNFDLNVSAFIASESGCGSRAGHGCREDGPSHPSPGRGLPLTRKPPEDSPWRHRRAVTGIGELEASLSACHISKAGST